MKEIGFIHFLKGKDKQVHQKLKLNEVFMEKEGKDGSVYYINIKNPLKDYENPYVWNYIQNDLIYTLLIGNKVYILVNDKEYGNIYMDYPDYEYSEVMRISNKDFNIDNARGEALFIYLNEYNADIVLDMIEGTHVWSYSGLVSFYAYRNKKDAEIYKSILQDKFMNEIDFVVTIKPTGDCLGICIRINNNIISGDELKNIVVSVLNKYAVKLRIM